MKTLVGLDLTSRSIGAVHFAAWLREAIGAEHVELTAMHVLERLEDSYAIRLRLHSTADLIELSAIAVRGTLQDLGFSEAFGSVEALSGPSAEVTLAHEALARNSELLIVGRRALGGGKLPPLLGRVTRRVLRRLPTTVAVVPPDLVREDIGSGPVVIATDLKPWSSAAAGFARRLATACRRPLAMVYVRRPLPDSAVAFLPQAALRGAAVQQLEIDRQRAEDWGRDHGIGSAEINVADGSPAGAILEFGQESKAAIVVCGSRRFSWSERAFRSSTASSVAGHARRPVLVVPSQEQRSTTTARGATARTDDQTA